MAIVVEDGTAKANANAYCSVAFVIAYLTETGDEVAFSALTTAQQEQAIVKATRYIDQRFASQFVNDRRTRTQSLEFPRYDIYDDSGQLWYRADELPREIEWATAEYANRASVAGALLISDPSSSRTPIETTKKIGPITKSERFSESSIGSSALIPPGAFSAYPTADLWIEKLLKGRQGSPLFKA